MRSTAVSARAGAGVVAFAMALAGCTYGNSNRVDDDDLGTACGDSTVRRGSIDAGELIEVAPAEGAGVFVEYESGGLWHVFVACDTERSDQACGFDILLEPVGASVVGLDFEDLEDEDYASIDGQDRVNLVTYTDYDFDGVYLATEPGARLSLDIQLDGGCANSRLFWVGDGALHEGAPSTPFELEPNEP